MTGISRLDVCVGEEYTCSEKLSLMKKYFGLMVYRKAKVYQGSMGRKYREQTNDYMFRFCKYGVDRYGREYVDISCEHFDFQSTDKDLMNKIYYNIKNFEFGYEQVKALLT